MTEFGGVNNLGTIFSYDISTGTETGRYDFGNGTNSGLPLGALLQAHNGLMYGTTFYNKVNQYGSIFSFNTSTDSATDLHDFNLVDGLFPEGSLMEVSDGLLYGMTFSGGAFDTGTIFSYDIAKDTEIVLHSFGSGTDGQQPIGSLMQASNGLLYGMTLEGGAFGNSFSVGGTIFSYNISTGIETDIHDFGSGNDGTYPWGSLIQARNGLLYGMTKFGGDF